MGIRAPRGRGTEESVGGKYGRDDEGLEEEATGGGEGDEASGRGDGD